MKEFNHPDGQDHPRPPSHLKKVKRYDFGEELFGQSSSKITKFLKAQKAFKSEEKLSLPKQIREFIYHKNNRKNYIEFANDYLKNKSIRIKKKYDIILVGAGVHSALFLYHLKKQNSKLKVLVLEKSTEICSTFYHLGDSLILNSPTFSTVGLNSNILEGHFIQASDFDDLREKPFPTAKHLYELATMIFLHSDAEIIFNNEVKKIEKNKMNYIISQSDHEYRTKNLIIASGMGDPKKTSFKKDKKSKKIISGDDFIANSFHDDSFFEKVKNKRIAVIGDGDSANCVMEYLLPLVYPNYYYNFYREEEFLPKFVYWIGQGASDIQEYFFANKSRYCHSGGIIEFFWDEETPFELSTEIWKKTKELMKCLPGKLKSLKHHQSFLKLEVDKEEYDVDLVIDCTGRSNLLSEKLLKDEYEFIVGNITLYGGQWIEELERFVVKPRSLKSKRLALQLKSESIFLLGSAGPLDQLIEDEEARDGSLKYQEDRLSLTNSKWSLEHTLPRTIAFAKNYQKYLAE